MLIFKGGQLVRQISRCGQQLRWRSSAAAKALTYSPGQKINGFTIQKVVPVPEFSLSAITLEHDKTKAQHLHIAREDTNNVFGVAFRTTPLDNTGVPHILEHTTLCGSQKYPVRDPFFKMLTRSLSTFMNAFTSNDWTMYPFSTQNRQDYYNLMSVYLDATFFPRLRELDFMQEGWRLEHENPQDHKSPIIFKGVVFNEMKGVFSQAQNLFSQRIQNLLLPDHTYGVVYGGEPASIVDLTWQQLKDFHASHYHPSNARFYTYGHLPLEGHLAFIDEHALRTFNTIDPKTEVPCQPRWTEPREAEMQCMPDPMAPDPAKQITVAVSYLLPEITDVFESFTLSLIGNLLTDGEKAPFYQSLIEAKLGSDYSPVVGYDGNIKEGSFSVGLQGVHEDNVSKVKAVIEDTIDKVIREGIEPERIDALLHTIELGQKHQSDKFGLNLGVGLLPVWNHDGDPTEVIQISKNVERFQEHLRDDPTFLQDKVNHYLKNNHHRLTLVMRPNEEFEESRQQVETEQLQSMVDKLELKDKANILMKGSELLSQQLTQEDLSCLPSLQIADIDPVAKEVLLTHTEAGSTPIQLCAQPTNGVMYVRMASSVSDLPSHLLDHLPLFCRILTHMGTKDMDYRAFSQKVDLWTGGLEASCHVTDHHTAASDLQHSVLFTSYCLDHNLKHMYGLWEQVFNRLELSDIDHLKTLILQIATELANSIAMQGHAFATGNAASTLSAAASRREQMNGLTQVSLMKQIAESNDMEPIIAILKEIAGHVLHRDNLRISLNATPQAMDSTVKTTEKFLSMLNSASQAKAPTYVQMTHQPRQLCSHYELPFQVNYVGRAVLTVPYTHADYASLRVLANLLTTRYLHREIREMGGAYGGGASGKAGAFSFYSYRDPNSISTLAAFDGAVEWAAAGNFDQQDIDEAKLSVFSQVDAPVSPGSEGMREFLHDIDHATFQQHRQQLFAVTKDDLIRVTKQYLSPDHAVSSVCLLGPKNETTSSSAEWMTKQM